MENQTFSLLHLEGLKVTHQSSYSAFIILLTIYIFTMMSNIGLVVLISMERILHQPMYLLLCSLTLNDALISTTTIPRIISDIFVDSADRYISYSMCVTQAFFAHFFATCCHTILMIMAFDRYVAICNPLRYATIMNNRMVVSLIVAAWGAAFILIFILIGLSIRLTRCRDRILHPFCDNASLFKLSCEDLNINNIYGLFITVLLLGSSMGFVTMTYLKITMVCLRSKNRVLNNRALQTCTTHLAVYVIMLVSGYAFVILHRFPQLSDQRKLASMMFYVVPPALNPVIYGLQSKEIRQRIFHMFQNNKVTV